MEYDRVLSETLVILSRSKPLGGSVTVQLWAPELRGCARALLREALAFPERHDGRTMWGVVTFPVPGGHCRCDWRSDAQGGTAGQDAGGTR